MRQCNTSGGVVCIVQNELYTVYNCTMYTEGDKDRYYLNIRVEKSMYLFYEQKLCFQIKIPIFRAATCCHCQTAALALDANIEKLIQFPKPIIE